MKTPLKRQNGVEVAQSFTFYWGRKRRNLDNRNNNTTTYIRTKYVLFLASLVPLKYVYCNFLPYFINYIKISRCRRGVPSLGQGHGSNGVLFFFVFFFKRKVQRKLQLDLINLSSIIFM